jgi:hypothetical protein
VGRLPVTGFSAASVHRFVLFFSFSTRTAPLVAESARVCLSVFQCYAFVSCALSEAAAFANPAMEQLCGKRNTADEVTLFSLSLPESRAFLISGRYGGGEL